MISMRISTEFYEYCYRWIDWGFPMINLLIYCRQYLILIFYLNIFHYNDTMKSSIRNPCLEARLFMISSNFIEYIYHTQWWYTKITIYHFKRYILSAASSYQLVTIIVLDNTKEARNSKKAVKRTCFNNQLMNFIQTANFKWDIMILRIWGYNSYAEAFKILNNFLCV